MSSTLRKQQIEEIKNYNQNINRQVLAKTHSQVALWELERPELTPITGEMTATIETETENLKALLNEKLALVDKVVEQGSITEKEFRTITKYSDVVKMYNELITPLLKGRFDYKYKSLAKNATITIKQEIVGLIIGFKKIIENVMSFGGGANVKIYVETYVVYDFINYQIDTENYQAITVEVLKSRIPQILSKLPEDVQLYYTKSQKVYEPLRATVKKDESLQKEDVFRWFRELPKTETALTNVGQLEQQSPDLGEEPEARAEPQKWSEVLTGGEERVRQFLRTYLKTYIKNNIIAGLNRELKDLGKKSRKRVEINRLKTIAQEVYDEKETESPRKSRKQKYQPEPLPPYEGFEQYEGEEEK